MDVHAIRSFDVDRDIQLLSPIFAEEEIYINQWNFTSNGHSIQTEKFDCGGGCSGPANCPIKVFDFDGSEIVCESFDAEFNYGSLTFSGNYEIVCSNLDAFGESFDMVTLKEYDSNTFSLSLDISLGTINYLIIDTDLSVELKRSFNVLNDVTIYSAQNIEFLSLGMNQTVNVGGNIINTTNTGSCYGLLSIEYTGSDECFISKSSGTLDINNVSMINVKTSGGAIFNATESIVYGTSSFWNVTNPPSLNYYWIGGDGEWTESTNWSLTSGGTPINSGCLPSLTDNVIVDNNSFSANNQSIEILDGESVSCNSFFWDANNYTGLQLVFPSGNDKAFMNIGNHMYLDPTLTVSATDKSEMILWSSDMELEAPVNTLPKLVLNNSAPVVSLLADLHCAFIKINQGTLFTNNFDITTEGINVIAGPANSVDLQFGTSTVTVNGLLNLQLSIPSQVSYDASQSTIICESLEVYDGDFKTLKFINSFSANGPRRNHTIEKLVLSGSNVNLGFFNSTVGESIIDTLVLEGPNAQLTIRNTDGVYINDEIKGTAEGAKIIGQSSSKQIIIPANLCVNDTITFEDVEIVGGTIHAPNGTDDGGNSNINFTEYTDQGVLYWVGKEANWNDFDAWSFASGACPNTTNSLSTYDTLIFDNNSFDPDKNEIFFSGNRTAKTILFKNTNVDAIVNVPFRLTADRIIADGGKVSFKDNVGNRQLDVNEYFHAKNNAQVTFDTITVRTGLRPDDFTESTVKIESGADLIGQFSILSIHGHGTSSLDYTIDFAGSNTIALNDCILVVEEPLAGQSNNNMTWNLLNETEIDKIQLFNSNGINQMIEVVSGFKTNQLNMEYGKMKVLQSANVDIQN